MNIEPARKNGDPTFAVAFGGGGARGLAHIHVIEVLDEMGVRPTAISGSSIGAIMGASMASGMTPCSKKPRSPPFAADPGSCECSFASRANSPGVRFTCCRIVSILARAAFCSASGASAGIWMRMWLARRSSSVA